MIKLSEGATPGVLWYYADIQEVDKNKQKVIMQIISQVPNDPRG